MGGSETSCSGPMAKPSTRGAPVRGDVLEVGQTREIAEPQMTVNVQARQLSTGLDRRIAALDGHEVQTSGERAVEDYPRVERGDRFSPLIPRRRWRHRHNRVLSEQFRKRISVTSLPGLHVSLHQDPMRRSVGGNDSN